ncbi:uncharacterized protein [Nothobranchius furzeri]|uniref:uncharacterized protein n=1 Tax=Nothobranchius furzeri TaxID=105023 RepID=UPI003904CC16
MVTHYHKYLLLCCSQTTENKKQNKGHPRCRLHHCVSRSDFPEEALKSEGAVRCSSAPIRPGSGLMENEKDHQTSLRKSPPPPPELQRLQRTSCKLLTEDDKTSCYFIFLQKSDLGKNFGRKMICKFMHKNRVCLGLRNKSAVCMSQPEKHNDQTPQDTSGQPMKSSSLPHGGKAHIMWSELSHLKHGNKNRDVLKFKCTMFKILTRDHRASASFTR